MNKPKHPSAGALRAAKSIQGIFLGEFSPDSNETIDMARIIDRETAAPDLLAALEEMTDEFGSETRWPTGEVRYGAKDILAKARAAIERATQAPTQGAKP